MKFQPALSAILMFVLLLTPVFSAPKAVNPVSRDARLFQSKLSKDKQIVHALDRLTFGPRPADVAEIEKLGLKKWIEMELNPDRIAENPFLQAKLTPLESLRMSSSEVGSHYPLPQMVRAVAEGKQPLPDDPILRASVERMVARYKTNKLVDGEGLQKPDNKADNTADNNGDLQPARPLERVLSQPQIKVLRSGTPEQKQQLLSSIPAAQVDDLVIAMPRPLRQQVFPYAPTDVRRKILLMNTPQQVVAFDLLESKLWRAIYGHHQLAEELDDFWFNHFNVFYEKGADRFLIPSFERDAIRPHVLGHFLDLLEATAKSPAMLFYLDNFQSVKPDMDEQARNKKIKRGLNENYARELMELHTLGVNGGYTQKDVIEVARCFTGWTMKEPRKGGDFFFNDKIHDKGSKIVLGYFIPAGGGIQDGEKVLDILAHHPSTAKFISKELAQRFVADDPPQALVDRMAKTFLDKGGDLREVMRTMLSSREFWSEGAYQAKIKTPFEMVVSAVRAVNADVQNPFALANQVAQLGEPLYRKQEPTGYSNLNAEWVNSAALLARMNFALALVQNKFPGVTVDTARFLNGGADEVAKALLQRELTPQTRATIQTALQEQQAKSPAPAPALIAGLVIGSPDFQRR